MIMLFASMLEQEMLRTTLLGLLVMLSVLFFYYCLRILSDASKDAKVLPLVSKIPEYLIRQNVSNVVAPRKSISHLRKQFRDTKNREHLAKRPRMTFSKLP